jgi:hypothetical protein
MAVPKSERPVAVLVQLRREFGINSADWQRVQFVYERHRLGDKRATKLVRQLDEGDLSPTIAKRLLLEALEDGEQVGDMASIQLPTLREQALHFNSFISTMAAALRQGVRLKTGTMSKREIADLCSLLEQLGTKTTRVASLLARETSTGGSTADDR